MTDIPTTTPNPSADREELPSISATTTTGAAPPVDLAPVWALIKRLPTYVRLSTLLARDSRVPPVAKASLALGGIYVISPVDLIPGLIPVAGQLDDLYVVLIGLQQAIRRTPDHVIEEHLATLGLTRQAVDEDLAALRTFVRQGAVWLARKGSDAVAVAGLQARGAVARVRKLRNKDL